MLRIGLAQAPLNGDSGRQGRSTIDPAGPELAAMTPQRAGLAMDGREGAHGMPASENLRRPDDAPRTAEACSAIHAVQPASTPLPIRALLRRRVLPRWDAPCSSARAPDRRH